MTKIEINNLKRVTKTAARKLHKNGINIYIVPWKVIPDFNGFWIQPALIAGDFDIFVNEYNWYNCNYNELGKYPAFYVKEEE